MNLCFIFLFQMMVSLFVFLVVELCLNMIHLFAINANFIKLMKINFFYPDFNLKLLIKSYCFLFDLCYDDVMLIIYFFYLNFIQY